MVHELQVDGEHGVALGHVHLVQEAGWDVQAGLRPHNVEITTELNTIFLKSKNK